MASLQDIKGKVTKAAGQFNETHLRWSYLILAGLFVTCVVVNWLFSDKHGWTVWPFAAGIGIMVMINEAAARAGQGVPPLQVYAFFIGVLVAWFVVMMALSVVNPFIILLGMGGLLYYCGRGYVEGKRREGVVAMRAAQGLCVHCGFEAEVETGYCDNCGNDPNPSATQLKRVQAVSAKNRNPERMRSILKPESNAATAGRKEQALMAKRRQPRGRS